MSGEQVSDAGALVSFGTNAISRLVSNREDIREDRRFERDFYIRLLERRGDEPELFAVTFFVQAELQLANWYPEPLIKLEELLKRTKALGNPTADLFPYYSEAFYISRSLGLPVGQTDFWIIAQTAHEKLAIATGDRKMARIAQQVGVQVHTPQTGIRQQWAQDRQALIKAADQRPDIKVALSRVLSQVPQELT